MNPGAAGAIGIDTEAWSTRSGDRHGFLNLLAAAVLADGDPVAILAEEDPTAFKVDDRGLTVHGHSTAVVRTRHEGSTCCRPS